MSYKYTYGTKHNKRPKLLIITLGFLMVLSGFLKVTQVHDLRLSQTQKLPQVVAENVAATDHKVSINYGLPVRLQIAKLGVDSEVKYVGLTKDGDMNMPANVYDLGWFKYGALPGNNGTAVIAGHLNGLRNKSGVFNKLTNLVKGDSITVIDSSGVIISFIVRDTRNYPQSAQPNEVFNSSSGSHLNLITCTGAWDSNVNSYAQRFVVFADKAS